MTKRVYYDALGKELKVGSIVAVPDWADQTMYFGVVKKLNHYNEHGGNIHRIEYYVRGEMWKNTWPGSAIITLNDSDAIMLRLQNFEPSQ